jgi:hypothetical protein
MIGCIYLRFLETHLTGQEHMDISSITNKIALVSVIALIYWVFVFICVQVFGLKVFGENLAQIFGLSIVGLCTVLAGAICVNIMHNLTIIARRHDGGQAHRQVRVNTRTLLLLAFSLAAIAALLFVGDMALFPAKTGPSCRGGRYPGAGAGAHHRSHRRLHAFQGTISSRQART